MQFPNGFFTPEINYNWLIHYYKVLREQGYDLYPNFDEFVRDYLNPHALIIQGPGIIIRVENFDSCHMAKVHGFVLGSEVFKCIDRIALLPKLVMDEFHLYRLESEIPETHRGVGRLLEKIGFTCVGRLRYRGKRGRIVFDTILYEIIRGD